ncbi:MAG: hypothetical protein ACREJC_08005, partial [Tepidisphaeraceae bacterium]
AEAEGEFVRPALLERTARIELGAHERIRDRLLERRACCTDVGVGSNGLRERGVGWIGLPNGPRVYRGSGIGDRG